MDIAELLRKYDKSGKVNYDHLLKEVIKAWTEQGIRPRILMHSCCAPCSTVMMSDMVSYADVTVYFSNSNIYPRSEYERRALVQRKFVEDFNAKTGSEVGFIEAEYKPNAFVEMVKSGNLELEKEGGARCSACFDMRLNDVALYAQEQGFDYFGSALTLSPHKNSGVINAIGFEVQKLYKTQYLPSDFKKNDGYRRSVEMCKVYDIYRQCYCGCVFAAKQQGVDLKQVNAEAKSYLKQSKACTKL